MIAANSMSLKLFLLNLADAFDGDIESEKSARLEITGVSQAHFNTKKCAFPDPIVYLMQQSDAHPLRDDIIALPFDWRPPKTSKSPLYAKHSVSKSHVELVGPDGLVKSD